MIFASTRIVLLGLAAVGVWGLPASSLAEGALAVGLPANVAKQGVSFGASFNIDTLDHARNEALARCRKRNPATVSGTADIGDNGRSLCAIVSTLHNECYAVSFDPKDGTPGFGWAIGNDLRSAEQGALANCEKTAGRGRRAACVVSFSGCDGTAK